MTTAEPERPRRVVNGFIAAAVIAVLGLALGGFVIVTSFGSFFLSPQGFEQGTATVVLDDAEPKSIYAVDLLPAGATAETCSVRQGEQSLPVGFQPLRPFQTVNGVAYYGWWDFVPLQAGAVTITCSPDMTWVVAGRAPGFGALFGGFAGIGITILSLTIAGITALVTAVIRSNARKRQFEPGPPSGSWQPAPLPPWQPASPPTERPRR